MTLSLEWIVGTVITLVLLAVAIFVAVWTRRMAANDPRADWILGAWAARVSAGIIAIVYVATTWPTFDMAYHSFAPVGGTVAAVESRFLGGEKSTTQNYAVRFTGSDQIYRCDDTRCSLLRPGDELHLSCIREWEYASTPGYSCRFVSSRAAGAA